MGKNLSTHFLRESAARFSIYRTLYWLSAYGVPLLIALFCLVSLLFWNEHYSANATRQIPFRMIEMQAGPDTPAAALTRLGAGTSNLYKDTKLSENPFWVDFQIAPASSDLPIAIEFPSRHATSLRCWDAASLQELGSATYSSASGKIQQLKTGFVLELGRLAEAKHLVCRQTFTGPAREEVHETTIASMHQSARLFEHNAGLLEGGLVVLALFVFVTALVNRESTYLVFAGWLVINLRMAQLSSGWDVQWMEHSVPPEWMYRIRLITTALYYLLTYTLFRTLFRDVFPKIGYQRLLQLTQFLSIPLLLGAMFLPHPVYLKMLWVCAAYGSIIAVFFLVRILMYKLSPVAIWYTASLTITLLSSLYEIISASMNIKGLIGTVNFVTAALSSSLMAALAIAAQLRNKHQQWMQAQAALQHTYDVMPIGLFSLDLHGVFISANPAMSNMLGCSAIRPGQSAWSEFFPDDTWQALRHMVQNASNGELEIRASAPISGESKQFLVKATLARDKIEGSLQDITARAKATAELQFMANNDPLTKVLNRRGIEALLDNALQVANADRPLLLAYLDLDRFKLINDLYGHPAGDEVLKQVCGRINAMLTGEQRVGRVGGDEFVIVFPNTPVSVAIWVCRGIVDSIGTGPYHFGDKAFQVRGSIGLIEVEAHTRLKDAVSTADRACREAKSSGNGLVVYEKNAAAFKDREAELRLMEKISNAGTPEGLFLLMQPIMSLRNPHESLNFEILLRMRDADGTVIPAGRVIAAAETSGRIGMIDRWVLTKTLEWINAHHAELDRTRFICLNLSGASLNDERFVLDAFDMLERNRQAAGMLCLEITESVALHDLENTRRFIDRVREYGVRIALDDFGAGYTSFTYLRDLPADVLKIDGSFIVNMNAHPANIAIVEAIVNLAANLGMKTIAEWAEDNATVQTLVEIGVDYVQGYAVAKPQTPVHILAAKSSASFIQDPELDSYARTLSMLTDEPPPFPPGVTLASSDGLLITK